MTEQNGQVERLFKVRKIDPIVLYGVADQHLRLIERHFPVNLIARGDEIKLRGEVALVEQVESILAELVFTANRTSQLSVGDVESLIHIVKAESDHQGPVTEVVDQNRREDLDEVLLFTSSGYIKPRTPGQQKILEAYRKNDLLIVVGPAGTGKTYLAVALAVSALKERRVKKIVLARPAVEAGESLGFLPGDFREKIDPYLRPLYDALEDMLPRELLKKYTEQGVIEVIPLAYMRGRTLNNAFVILDEAQNATSVQMKMFLTRLGANSRAIVNGDITQIDLPETTQSGLIEISEILSGIEGISIIRLDRGDVVRHRLVREIIEAYEQHQNEQLSGERNKS